MHQTQYTEINKILEEILGEQKNILGKKLIGLYIYGSLVWGDFDEQISDIDLLTVVSNDISDQEFEDLKKMHQDLVERYPAWDNRIETQYLSIEALQTFKTKESPAITISPGEPIHRITVGKHWLMNWYIVREKGMILFGPDPKAIIEPITKEEFLQSVKDHVQSWNEWVKTMKRRKAQSYAILTMCRALYAFQKGEQPSKQQAAIWAKEQLPDWADVVDNALKWRKFRDNQQEDNENFPKTEEFVNYVRNEILG